MEGENSNSQHSCVVDTHASKSSNDCLDLGQPEKSVLRQRKPTVQGADDINCGNQDEHHIQHDDSFHERPNNIQLPQNEREVHFVKSQLPASTQFHAGLQDPDGDSQFQEDECHEYRHGSHQQPQFIDSNVNLNTSPSVEHLRDSQPEEGPSATSKQRTAFMQYTEDVGSVVIQSPSDTSNSISSYLKATGDTSHACSNRPPTKYQGEDGFRYKEDRKGAEFNSQASELDLEKPQGFTSYLWSELSRGYEPDENEAVYNVKRERVYAFLRIPKECEKFMFYGSLQCIDSFLFIFTFLPLRLMIILLKVLAKPWNIFTRIRQLSASQKCDVAKGIIIAFGCLLIHQIDASFVYHMIRSQSTVKLYIFFNLLDIGDRLLSSFGQDILDALMWAVADPKGSVTAIFLHYTTAVIYAFLHSMLVLLQASALNVAFNSHNKALLSILISNNAVELKGSVFKKFEKTNLFQMSCSDVRERFHLQVMVVIVCLRNMTDSNWDIGKFINLIPDILTLMACEVAVDATKHAFITKFNNIPAKVYREYTALLANDVITSRRKNAFSDVSDQVSRRLGLIPLPLACLLIKIVMQCLKVQTPLAMLNIALGLLCLLIAKLVIGVVVCGWAVDYYRDYCQQQAKQSKRARHQSGIDEDLLRCENNYHWHKKPLAPAAPAHSP